MKKTVMQYLKERDGTEDKVTIKVNSRDKSAIKQAHNVAAATNSDIELTKEQNAESSLDLAGIAKELRGLLEQALRDSGMEVSISEIQDVTKESFSISIEHPNENTETYKFRIDPTNQISISSQDYLRGEVVKLGEVGVRASGEPVISGEVIKSELVKYFSQTPLSLNVYAKTDLAPLNNFNEVEAGITEEDGTPETFSIGHVDDEAGMMKQAAAEIVEYGQTLYDLFTYYEQTQVHVDFPHWFQSLIVRSRDYIGKASHYLEFETQDKPIEDLPKKVRSLYNTALTLEKAGKLTLEHKQKIQKLTSSYKK